MHLRARCCFASGIAVWKKMPRWSLTVFADPGVYFTIAEVTPGSIGGIISIVPIPLWSRRQRWKETLARFEEVSTLPVA
jgi:hypothetical protein